MPGRRFPDVIQVTQTRAENASADCSKEFLNGWCRKQDSNL